MVVTEELLRSVAISLLFSVAALGAILVVLMKPHENYNRETRALLLLVGAGAVYFGIQATFTEAENMNELVGIMTGPIPLILLTLFANGVILYMAISVIRKNFLSRRWQRGLRKQNVRDRERNRRGKGALGGGSDNQHQ